MDAKTQTSPVLVYPRPSAPHFEPCKNSEVTWPCPSCGGQGGYWYAGEAVPGEYVINELPVNDSWGTLWSPDVQHVRDMLKEFLAGELAAEGGVAAVEQLLEEEGEEEDRRRGSSVAGGLVPPEVPELEEGRPVGLKFWHMEDAPEEGQEAPISEQAEGKAPTVELPPPEIDEELVQRLQWEVYVADEVRHGQDAATLVVVREAASPLMWGQLEGLGEAS